MSIEILQGNQASEAQAIAEIGHAGFAAAAKLYEPGRTEPHRHDYDICIHVFEGEFRLGLVEEGSVRSFEPGERLLVPAGTLHYEEHGHLRMVVGRREPGAELASPATETT
jgi:quercetin dioxygenase-like cupin family protein